MTTKEWFERARFCRDKIKSLKRLRDELLSDVASTTHPPKTEVVQTSRANNTENKLIDYIVDSEDIDRQIERLDEERRAVIDVIYSVENPKYQELLSLRYLQNKKWEEISEEMGYEDVRSIYRMHIRAVSAAEPIIRKIAKEIKL